jgi:hypothetical protein
MAGKKQAQGGAKQLTVLKQKVARLEAQVKILTKWDRQAAKWLMRHGGGDPPPPDPPKDFN